MSVTRAPPPPVGSRIRAEDAASGAGTQGDAVKVLESLPGLGRAGPGAGSAQIIAWGSAPSETRIELDGVPLPVLYHGSAIRSVIPPEELARLSVVPGAYGAAHGRGLGGLVMLETRRAELAEPHLRAHADLIDAGAGASVPLGAALAVSASGRASLVDRLLPRLTNQDLGRLVRLPGYRDALLRASFTPSVEERLDAVLLGSRDAWRHESASSDRSRMTREQEGLGFWRAYLRYERGFGDERSELTPFLGVDSRERSVRIGNTGSGLAIRTLHYGLRGAFHERPSDGVALELGVDALGSRSEIERSGTPTLPPREGDPRVLGEAPGPETAYDRYAVQQLDVAPYGQATFDLGALRITPGLRADVYLLETDRLEPRRARVPAVGASEASVVLEPRLTLDYALSDTVHLLAAAGLYHQPPAPEDMSAVFGNPRLGLARALHASGGERVTLGSALSVEVIGYYKQLMGLPARSPAPTPELAALLVPEGAGRSYGAQISIEQAPRGGFSLRLAWTIARSERRDAAGARWRRFDFDQPHVLALVSTQRLGSWSFGARFRFTSGAPRTPVSGASYDLGSERYQPILGATNAARLPAFAELDLRVDHTFAWGAARFSLFADALDVLGRRNPEDMAYSFDYRERAAVTGLPPMLVVGASFER